MKKQIAVLTAIAALLLAGCSETGTTVTAGEGAATDNMPVMPGGVLESSDAENDAGEAYNQGVTEIAFEVTYEEMTPDNFIATEIAPFGPETSTEQEQSAAPVMQLSYESGGLATCMNIYSPSYIWNGLCVDGTAAVTGGYKANLYADSAQIRLDFAGADAPDSVVVSCGEADSETESVLSDDLVFEAEAGKEYYVKANWGDNSACYIFRTTGSSADSIQGGLTAAEPYTPADTATEEQVSQGYNPNE